LGLRRFIRSTEGESRAISSSSRLMLSNRSECDDTRWLQPAQAERGTPRPWITSSSIAAGPQCVRCLRRLGLITSSNVERSHRPAGDGGMSDENFEKAFLSVAAQISYKARRRLASGWNSSRTVFL
jgi:hypothetical protein